MLQNSSLSSVEEKSFDENSSQELSLESLSEISGGKNPSNPFWGEKGQTKRLGYDLRLGEGIYRDKIYTK